MLATVIFDLFNPCHSSLYNGVSCAIKERVSIVIIRDNEKKCDSLRKDDTTSSYNIIVQIRGPLVQITYNTIFFSKSFVVKISCRADFKLRLLNYTTTYFTYIMYLRLVRMFFHEGQATEIFF